MPPQQKRKRGRPSASTEGNDASQGANDESTAPRPRKRGRPSNKDRETTAANLPTAKKAARKTRDRQGDAAQTEEASEPSTAKQSKAPKRGRPSLGNLPAAEAQNKSAKGARGGKRKQPRATNQDEDDGEPADAGKGKRGGATGGASSVDKNKRATRRQSKEVASEPEAQASSQQRRNRRQSNASTAEVDDAPPPPSPSKPYPHIVARTRRIRRSHVSSKWAPLAAPSLAAASTLLTLAQRPIFQRLSQTSNRRQHTNTALNLIMRRITRRLGNGIPFPPAALTAGKETELDFESVLDGKAALERQLDPAVHAVELLKREKDRIEKELERDYGTLRNLEAGARTQARQQRDLLKKAHVLAPERLRLKEVADVVFKREESDETGPAFSGLEDEDLKAVALQLGGHMESMRTNLEQAEGILPGMKRSRAVLQDVLLRNLDLEQYEHVVLS